MESSPLVHSRRGAGSPVLLLHGLGHRRQAWNALLPRLAERHEVIAVDLPGFGSSPAPEPEEPYDVTVLVDLLVRWCAELDLGRPHVAGHSLGGALALELGARGLARSVTALSPIGFTARHENTSNRVLLRGMGVATRVPPQMRRAVAASPAGRAIARRMLRGDPRAEAAAELKFNADKLAAGSPFVRLAPHVLNYVFTPREIPCPVTVAWGDRDRVLPARAIRRVPERIPHARQVVLLGCGHIPMADHPGAVAAVVLDTCTAAEPRVRGGGSVPPFPR